MDSNKLYHAFFNEENQSIYRDKLIKIISKSTLNRDAFSKKIGISVITLRAFVAKGHLVGAITFTKISNFVDKEG